MWEAEVSVSRGCATTLQPGRESQTSTQEKKVFLNVWIFWKCTLQYEGVERHNVQDLL